MPTIPKVEVPDAAQVREAEETLARAERTEATLRERLAQAKTRAAELAEAAADAAVLAIELEDDSIFETADAASDAAASEVKKLTQAIASATRNHNAAKLQVTRVKFQRHAGEIAKLCEKRLGRFLKLEAAIDQVVAAYRAAQDSCTAISAAWPGPVPIAGFIDLNELAVRVQRELYRQSARPGTLGMADGPHCFPGAAVVGEVAFLGEPHKMTPLSSFIEDANRFLGQVLKGERVLSRQEFSSGEYLAPVPTTGESSMSNDKPVTPSIATPETDVLSDEEMARLNEPQPGARKVSEGEALAIAISERTPRKRTVINSNGQVEDV